MKANGSAALLTALLLGGLAPFADVRAAADEAVTADNDGHMVFSSLVYVQAYWAGLDLAQSPLNPGNVLGLPSSQAKIELRPDLSFHNDTVEINLKPRFSVTRKHWNEGPLDGTSDSDSEAYFQEGYARFRLNDRLFVSAGRENLQWGPSYLLSPSNVFNTENGRNSPQDEVAGMDYARMIWIPNHAWSASVIVNTGKGELDQADFKKAAAIKIDYTNEQKYFSIIPAYREGGETSLGYFAGWTASDALLLYLEGRVGEGGNSKQLLGGAYTLEGGATIAVEYFHDSEGCTAGSVILCYTPSSTPLTSSYVRKNYLMLQYLDTAWFDDINLTARYIHDLDDDSSRLIGVVEYEFKKNAKLFAIGNLYHGEAKSEYGSLVDQVLMIGLGYTF